MKTDSLVLLPQIEAGVPSGNYDGSTDSFVETRQKAADYYKHSTVSQDIQFRVNDFVGSIIIEASLDENPVVDADWFSVHTFPSNIPDSSTAVTSNTRITVTGNFTWIRARVQDFSDGFIEQVLLVY